MGWWARWGCGEGGGGGGEDKAKGGQWRQGQVWGVVHPCQVSGGQVWVKVLLWAPQPPTGHKRRVAGGERES